MFDVHHIDGEFRMIKFARPPSGRTHEAVKAHHDERIMVLSFAETA